MSSVQAEEKRQQIIWALYECLSENGQERVTIKEIASRAGLPHGVIHYYFKNKDEIITALAEAIVESLVTRIDQTLKSTTPEDMHSAIIDFITKSLVMDEKLGPVFYNLIQLSFEREELHRMMKKMLRDYRKQMALFIEKYTGVKPQENLGALLVALTEGIGLQVMMDRRSFTEEKVRAMVEQSITTLLSLQ
jgi:AcrR family transcriptional regulator